MQSKHPISLRLTPEMDERLDAIAAKLKIKKHTLAQLAVEAAVEAAERDGALVMPIDYDTEKIKFEVQRIPVARGIHYGSSNPQALGFNDANPGIIGGPDMVKKKKK